MRVVGLHHVQITIPVGEEERARWFYCTVLGLPEIEKPASLSRRGGIWLQAGDRQVHVGVESGVNRTATKAHIAYQVNALDRWRRRLREHGVASLDAVPISGYDRLECRDPFGNRVELIEPLTRAASD